MRGFDGKLAGSITRTPPKHKLYGGNGQSARLCLDKGPDIAPRRHSADHNCLRYASVPLDIRKSGVISEGTAKGTIIGPDRRADLDDRNFRKGMFFNVRSP
jgi:hypothetical protein